MNLQQAAKQYAWPIEKHTDHILDLDLGLTIESAFIAGAAFADGKFAEWCSENGWYYIRKYKIWGKPAIGIDQLKTTAELYQLWQQSLI